MWTLEHLMDYLSSVNNFGIIDCLSLVFVTKLKWQFETLNLQFLLRSLLFKELLLYLNLILAVLFIVVILRSS